MAFLRGVWSILVGVKDALVLILLLLLFGGLWTITSMQPTVKFGSGGALRIDLDGTLVDEAAEISPMAVLSGTPIIPETEVRDVVRAIDAAATDNRIKAIVLELDGFLGGGQANLEAVSDSLARFRASGKTVHSWASAYTDGSYFLAAHADRIWLAPQGAVLLAGPGGSGLYFKEALDRLRVNVEVFRVGTYKSFVEPFTRSDRSPEARVADQQLADDIWANYRAGIEAARPDLDLDALLTAMPARMAGGNQGTSQLALASGLVDQLAGPIEFGEALRAQLGNGAYPDRPGDYAHIDLRTYMATHVPSPRSGAAVGVVHIAGAIIDGEAPAGQAGGDSIAQLINKAIEDADVKALVVRIDSGGGSVMASERIREALLAARARKMPVVASFGPVAASGGYWVATAADAIYARPSTVTGSIGVFGLIPTFEGTLENIGISTDFLGTTPFSGQPDLFGGLNPPIRDFLQTSVAHTYGHFIQLVADARQLPVADVEALAEGRVWSGQRAMQLGLIDHFGDLDAAVADAARRAKISTPKPRIKVMRRDRPLLWQLVNSGFSGNEPPPADAVSMLVTASRARAMAQFEAALAVAQGPGIQAQCFSCAGYQPPRGNLRQLTLADVLAKWQ